MCCLRSFQVLDLSSDSELTSSRTSFPNLASISSGVVSVSSKDPDREFLDGKCEELLQHGGIVLLKPMSSQRIDKLLTILNDYKDISATTISNGNNDQIVLRYKPEKKRTTWWKRNNYASQ